MNTNDQQAVATRPLGLVTGASSGIGRSLARQFVQNGFDVLVVAEDDGIEQVAAELGTFGQVRAIKVDLATQAGNDDVIKILAEEDRPLAAAAINAGVGVYGPLIETDLADHLRLLAVNIVSTVHLGQAIATQMCEQGSGHMLFTSSVASQLPGPYYTTYASSRSFVQSFAYGLRDELRDSGVTVTALMPRPTDTNFFDRAGMQGTKVDEGPKDDPDEVAATGFAAMMAGDGHVVSGGLKNKAQTDASAVMPDDLLAKMHRRQTQPAE